MDLPILDIDIPVGANVALIQLKWQILSVASTNEFSMLRLELILGDCTIWQQTYRISVIRS